MDSFIHSRLLTRRVHDARSGALDGAELIVGDDGAGAAVGAGKAGHVSAGRATADTASSVAADGRVIVLDTGEAVAADRVGDGDCSKASNMRRTS